MFIFNEFQNIFQRDVMQKKYIIGWSFTNDRAVKRHGLTIEYRIIQSLMPLERELSLKSFGLTISLREVHRYL